MSDSEGTQPEETKNSFVCPECDPDLPKRGFYQTQIRRLREKLEYSTLQNSLLALECERLREQLREAKFQGRSSIQRLPTPPLPNEILRLIFEEAVKFDGLVTQKWNAEEGHPQWTLSLHTRLAIPLVCRQWHMVGLELLYNHIFLFKTSQAVTLSSVLTSLEHRDMDLLNRRLEWIRGLEFFVITGLGRQSARFALLGGDLIDRLRKGQLQLFGVETEECGSDDKYAMELVNAGLYKSRGSIRQLHLPCLVDSTSKASKLDYVSRLSDFRDVMTDFAGFANLENLSLTCGKYEVCGGQYRTPGWQEIYRFLARNPTSLKSVTINCLVVDYSLPITLDFMRSAALLRTVHIILSSKGKFLSTNFNDFLSAVPALQDLILEVFNRHGGYPAASETSATPIQHQSLKRVVLLLDSPAGFKLIAYFLPIFDGIKKRLFTAVEEVLVRGPYPRGCLDGSQVYPLPVTQSWQDAIATCAAAQVNLVNEHGQFIHLWKEAHGIQFEPNVALETDEEVDDRGDVDSESEETDDSYWEEGSSEYEGSIPTGEDVENDSDDGPYQYMSRPDLCYESNSESEND